MTADVAGLLAEIARTPGLPVMLAVVSMVLAIIAIVLCLAALVILR